MRFQIPTLLLLLLPTPSVALVTPPRNIIVISPPGGIGEVATVSCAKKGASVKWCVVSSSSDNDVVTLSEESLRSISAAGGNVDIVGSDAASLLLKEGAEESSRGAVKVWGRGGGDGGIICTLDGAEGSNREEVEDAVKVAVREVCGVNNGNDELRVIVLPIDKGVEEESASKGIMGFFGPDVPGSMVEAVGEGKKVVTLRHGELFGIPESSKDASPFINGPRRTPLLREEYTLRSVRLTPTPLPQTRTSRLSIGDAAALLTLQTLPPTSARSTDVYLTSSVGSDELTEEEWIKEYARCNEKFTGSKIFSSELVVLDVDRMSTWLATKWAPAILRTYDIAGIRVGGRPVYAEKVSEDTVQIVWQQLVNFDSVTVGKMIITVTEEGIAASRAGGDASKGYGLVPRESLQGEDILLKSLGDAASQAIEKGLAKKPKRAKPKKQVAAVVAPVVVPTPVVQEEIAEPSRETGPRSAGARRSSQRARGKRRKDSKPAEDATPKSWQ